MKRESWQNVDTSRIIFSPHTLNTDYNQHVGMKRESWQNVDTSRIIFSPQTSNTNFDCAYPARPKSYILRVGLRESAVVITVYPDGASGACEGVKAMFVQEFLLTFTRTG